MSDPSTAPPPAEPAPATPAPPEPPAAAEPPAASEPPAPQLAAPAPQPGPPRPKAGRGPLGLAVAFLASYGFACVLLLLLCLLVFLGTLEQVDHGLFEVQKRYFNSPFLVHWLELGAGLSLPIPLPGVHLLLALLSVNLLLGGLVRIQKSSRTLGIIVAHLGIALLLLGGMVTFWFSDEGQLTLQQGRRGAEFRSYHEWELAIYALGPDLVAPEGREELLLRERDLRRAPATFHHARLPFELRLDGFWPNARPTREPAPPNPTIEGWALRVLPLEKEAEANMAGAYVTVLAGGAERTGIVWGFEHFPLRPCLPWVVEQGGAKWAIELRRRVYDLPFTIQLDKFTHEYHPGTERPRSFMSDVTMVEDGVATAIKIRMNEPLRHRGYTLFQAGFGPKGAGPTDDVWSTFAVVRNPADHWPVAACAVISLGLLVHFLQKLLRWVRAQANKAARPPEEAA